MDLKVRAVEGPSDMGSVEIEEKLIVDAEAQHEGTEAVNEEVPVVDATTEGAEVLEESSLSDEDVLSFLKNKYGREANTLDEFTAVDESSDAKGDLPEDVAAYLQYKETTGRGMGDYLKLSRDLESMDSNALLKEYLLDTETGLDSEDVEDMLSEYEFDADVDEDADVRKIKRAKKKAVAKAKEYFTDQAKMYKEPSETLGSSMSNEDKEGLEAYRSSLSEAKSSTEANEARSSAFTDATDKFFSDDFKGFDFKVGDDTISFNAGSAEEVKNAQSTPMNFINKYMDKDGIINDAAGYHKALAAAMQPDKFAQFFYEQGQANAKGDVLRSTKNINMGTRTAPEVSTTGGMKVRAVPTTHGNGLKIRSNRK